MQGDCRFQLSCSGVEFIAKCSRQHEVLFTFANCSLWCTIFLDLLLISSPTESTRLYLQILSSAVSGTQVCGTTCVFEHAMIYSFLVSKC
jgi:hypothetical protein